MLRLLQGDVGSGKTIVALLAMAQAAEAGGQSALMAPTEVLARQHYATIGPLAEKAGLRIAILTSNEKGKERESIFSRLADGSIDILIGTHAVFQEAVAYKNLVFAVVDEQHRFGVHQRLQLAAKGESPHLARHDRHAHSPHACADGVRRDGCFQTHGKARRPQADPHRHRPR